MKNQIMILTPISSLDAPLERSASSRIIMKEFSLSSNLKLSIDIFIMSVRHVFADFRFIFVKCSCSRRDSTSLFSLFYKIILFRALDCEHFFESVRVKIWSGRTLCHTARVSRAEAEQRQCVCRMGASAGAQRCAQQTSTTEDLVFKLK